MIKNITLSAEDILIKNARLKAKIEHKSLNELFRQWLKNYAVGESISDDYGRFMQKCNYACAGKKFTRDELNER